MSAFEDFAARAALCQATSPDDLIAQIRDTVETIEGLARALRQAAAILQEESGRPSQNQPIRVYGRQPPAHFETGHLPTEHK